MKNELVSIIVPTYNSHKYIRECLDSLLIQTYNNIEIVVIDDGSIDNTKEIIKSYKDDRIVFIEKQNTGVSNTRNIGIDIAKGNFISFVDSDDFVDPDYIKKMYECCTIYNVDAVRCSTYFYDSKNNMHMENLYSLANKKIMNEEINEVLFHFITSNENIACYMPLLLIKKDKIVKFNENLYFMEDTDFYVRLFSNISSIYFLDEKLYNYRYNYDSSSKNEANVEKNIFGIINSISNIKLSLEKNKLLNESLEKEINKSAYYLIFTKLKIASKANVFSLTKKIKKIFDDNLVRDIIFNLDYISLTKVKKMEYQLIKNRCYFLLAIIIKISERR